MQNGYGVTQSPLSIIAQERNAWKDVTMLSRKFKDRKIHSYAVRHVKELGKLMMSIAEDEMTSGESDEEENISDEFGDGFQTVDGSNEDMV